MNKRDLTTQVAQKTGVTNTVALAMIDAIFQSIRENLEKSESVVLQGFGSFTIKERTERTGINPATKEPLTIPAHKVVKFTTSKNVDIK